MVSINLNNFMNMINKAIVKRGNKYYEDGRVNHLRQYDPLKYSAMVTGTTTYYVDVELNDCNDIIKSSCTCPYQQSEYCKHQVSVFYELLKGKPNKVDRPVVPKKQSSVRRTRTGYSETIKEELVAAKNILLLHIKQGKKQGFIDYYHMPDVIHGFQSVLELMEDKLKDGDYEGVIQLGLIVLPLIADVSGYCDDSDGGVSEVIYHTLNLLNEAIDGGEGTWDPVQKQVIFSSLLKESEQNYYKEMPEWRYKLLNSCVPLCDLPDNRSTLDTHIQKLLNEEQNSKWVDDYSIEELLLIKYSIINRYDDREKAYRFVDNYLEYHRFRILAIERKFLEDDYLSVIRLCRDGEKVDKNFLFHDRLHELLRYRYEASKCLNNPELMRESARDLLLEGIIDYYFILKEMYTKDEWPDILQPIIEKLSHLHEDVAIGILIQENRTDQLYEFIVTHPYKIIELYPYLLKDHANEVHQIFAELIREEAEKANNRKLYKRVCDKIKIFKKACGSDATIKLIEELQETHKRRPALLDELKRIN